MSSTAEHVLKNLGATATFLQVLDETSRFAGNRLWGLERPRSKRFDAPDGVVSFSDGSYLLYSGPSEALRLSVTTYYAPGDLFFVKRNDTDWA